MTYRIGWLSPFTAASGVGTFSHAVTQAFPLSYNREAIDLTILHPPHTKIYRSAHRRIQIEDSAAFQQIMPLFDLLIYNIGNNAEHHELIFRLLNMYPGIVICHDYVFQHYLARRSMHACNNFSSYGALLTKYGDAKVPTYIKRSRITSRTGGILYSPWDSEYSVTQPLSEVLLGLGSALVLHSKFALEHAVASFSGPAIKLGMPYDQKRIAEDSSTKQWSEAVLFKRAFHLVCFGHIQSTKCIDLILDAIAASKVLRQKIRYTIAGFVGDPSYFSQLQEMVNSLSLRDIVTFEISVSETRLDHLMQEADIFINLRRPNTEGSSASLIEQLEASKPVIVLDSGSYSEIPADAAVKLPADAGMNDIRIALEKLVCNPESMPGIGRAGQAYGRSWSCASYGESILRFAFENRIALEARASIVSVNTETAIVPKSKGDAWEKSLARARRSLRYLDKNMLSLDPEIIMGMRPENLGIYVSQMIFGLFNRPGLDQALARYFVKREGQKVYWACVKFMLIADAVFDGNQVARQRLSFMPPCLDVELWAVIEQLPPAQFLAAAQLLLPGSRVAGQHQSITEYDVQDGAGRLLIIDLLDSLPHDSSTKAEQLRRWLEEPSLPQAENDLPVIDENFKVDIGSPDFRDAALLRGFHTMEPDHAWMRGRRGFIGLKLGSNVVNIALLIKHVDAQADVPRTIHLSNGTSGTEIEVRDTDLHWVTLNIPQDLSDENSTSWIRIATSYASRPPNSLDTRILGCCVHQLKLTVKSVMQRPDVETILLRNRA